MIQRILLLLVCCTTTGWAQKIYFPKEQYADSTAMAKNIPALAEKAIALYKEADKAAYLDNLFRLELTAKRYKAIETTLNQLEMVTFGDSITKNHLGFGYRVYAKTASSQPKTPTEFESNFKRNFHSLYNSLNNEGHTSVGYFYNTNLKGRKITLELKLKDISVHDSITVKDAVDLCRAYCAYNTSAVTLALGKQFIAAIEAEKYLIDENIIITLPNGSTIAGTMVRNKNINGPQPVVMMYNIYAGIELSLCKEMVDNGYVGFMANTRGKRLSNDPIEPYEHDGDDAYHILDWVSKQSWCNGKIGMYGGSYLGFSQWSAMKKVHPALKTIIPQVAVGAGIDFPMQNNVFMGYALSWIRFVSNNKMTDAADFENNSKWESIFADYYTNGKSFRSLDKIEGKPSPLFQRWLDHPSYDSYWKNMTPQKEAFANINIPILTTTGYYDDDQLGAMYYYKEYQKWNKNDNYYLVIGPYDHGGAQGFPKSTLGGYEIDAAAQININDLIFEWFDYILKDGKRPEILKDKVNFQVMGKNEWKHVGKLQQMHNETLTFYLGTGDRQGQLVKAGPEKLDTISQTVDFKDRSEVNLFKSTDVCSFRAIDNATLDTEKQMLVFESNPIEEPLTISGSLSASLKVRTNKKDMDIAIQLYEKTADNHYFALSNNLQRASYAEDRSKRKLLKPNTVETININNTFITSKQLQKGSRIVIVMGVNKNPNWQVNYGTGKDVSDETMQDAAVPMEIKWYSNSTINIPVLR
ncbi:CocE/NonD family hydrolase [Flavobacterium amniphilum]|uniref:CocE/NonD family hydrolase n=1 Tax=Flavobacterium amniphilum TaxID=1834035 RepID=UPI002029E5C3|nr:CocE/NonD family hydrolase [Flavobacterium amniphilum]MCL9805448.1 CocE/NonD family hydrolase [Flavobacterium amniphilum]